MYNLKANENHKIKLRTTRLYKTFKQNNKSLEFPLQNHLQHTESSVAFRDRLQAVKNTWHYAYNVNTKLQKQQKGATWSNHGQIFDKKSILIQYRPQNYLKWKNKTG